MKALTIVISIAINLSLIKQSVHFNITKTIILKYYKKQFHLVECSNLQNCYRYGKMKI